MKKNRYPIFMFVAALFIAATAYSAPQKVYNQETSIAIREMRASIDEMRHEMNNHETEIRTFEDKLANQEVIIESLREQNAAMSKINQELAKSSLANLEMKINSLDTASKALVSDLKQFKSHANDSTTSMNTFNQKIAAIEKVLEAQSQNLDNLQSAMRSLMSVLEVKHDLQVADDATVKTYKVQPGDSLDKIAKLHKTTSKLIKELNNLNSDRIIVGQNIKIP